MEDLQTARDEHGCGTINAQDGSGNKEVVAKILGLIELPNKWLKFGNNNFENA